MGEPQFKPRRQPQPRLSDPAQIVVWGGTLQSRRRALVGSLSGLSIGAAGDVARPTLEHAENSPVPWIRSTRSRLNVHRVLYGAAMLRFHGPPACTASCY